MPCQAGFIEKEVCLLVSPVFSPPEGLVTNDPQCNFSEEQQTSNVTLTKLPISARWFVL